MRCPPVHTITFIPKLSFFSLIEVIRGNDEEIRQVLSGLSSRGGTENGCDGDVLGEKSEYLVPKPQIN